jgi:hypothetical protein
MIYVPPGRSRSWLPAERPQEVALALTDYGVPVDLLDTDTRDLGQLVAALGAGAARG